MTPDKWFYAKGKTRLGPYTYLELQRLAGLGALSRSDMVWQESSPRWIQAGNLPSLFVDPTPLSVPSELDTRPGAVPPPAVKDGDFALPPAEPPWYFLRGEHKSGPYTSQQLLEIVRLGQVQLGDLVWREGMHSWLSLSHILPELQLLMKPKRRDPPTSSESLTGCIGVTLFIIGLMVVSFLVLLLPGGDSDTRSSKGVVVGVVSVVFGEMIGFILVFNHRSMRRVGEGTKVLTSLITGIAIGCILVVIPFTILIVGVYIRVTL